MPTRALRDVGAPSAAVLKFLRRSLAGGTTDSRLPQRIACCAVPPTCRYDGVESRSTALGMTSPPKTSAPSSPWPTRSVSRPCLSNQRSGVFVARPFSTTARTSGIWEHLWRAKRQQVEAQLRTQDLPPLASFLDENSLSGRALKPANDMRLRCTEFDEKGDVTLVNGEFKKSELIAKVRSLVTSANRAYEL